MKPFFLSAFILLSFASLHAQDKNEAAIRALLLKQEKQWNSGNLDGFMKGYWESDSLLFIGSKGPKYGYLPTLEGYKKSYPDTAHMGAFTSTVVSVKRLSKKYYFVVGKWYLKRSVGDASGSYTLLFRKIKNEWVIVADHSS